MSDRTIKTVKCWGGGTLKAKLKRSFNSRLKPIFKTSFNFIKEHRTLPMLIILVLGLSFILSRLVLADTVTLKYKDENANEQSLTLNKGSTIYLDPNFGYFKKDKDKRTKKLTLNTDIDLTDNEDINTNPYVVAKANDPKGAAGSDSTYGKNTTFSSIRTMQEMNPTICANETTPTKAAVNTTTTHSTNTNLVPEARLKDTRDNRYYTIRKLADGNCWMTDNLAYAKAGTLSPTDSDVQNSNFSLTSSDIYTKDGEEWGDEDDKKFIYDRPDPTYGSTSKPKPNFILKGWRKTHLSNGSISLKAIYDTETNPLYGNLYTWYTATAGTGTYSMSNKGTNANSSICPRGWRLPPNDGANSYQNLLFTSYGLKNDRASSTKMQGSPLDFNFAGFYRCVDEQTYYMDDIGHYWSSTVGPIGSVYILHLYSSGRVNPQAVEDKAYGLSVRCVAR